MDDKKNMEGLEMSKSDVIEIEIAVETETERAILVDFGGDELVWLPRSQIELVEGAVLIPEWLAMEKGMI